MTFDIGQKVRFAGVESTVRSYEQATGIYHIATGEMQFPMAIPEKSLEAHQQFGGDRTLFNTKHPDLIVVDDFFSNPDEVREIALAQEYKSDLKHYKGLRTTMRFLWPYLREEFGRLLGKPVTEWLSYLANGCFQKTSVNDPLVWHADNQQYAAAVYLTPNAPTTLGTSFWRDKTYGCRYLPSHPYEAKRLGSVEAVYAANSVVNDPFNITHPDNWELVESVAGLYNRLVIWDAKLIHSATSYVFESGDPDAERLVQLFFFDAN